MRINLSGLCMACTVAGALSLASCMEKDLYDSSKQETPSLATFATTQDVQFAIQYSVPSGYNNGFDVYSENPMTVNSDGSITLRTDIEPIASGIAESGVFNMMKRIPGYVKELYAYSTDLYATRLMHATISNGYATFKAVDFSTLIPTTSAMTTRSTKDLKLDIVYAPAVDSRHTPAFDGYANLPLELYYTVRTTFPNGKSLFETNKSKYVQEATMEVQEDAELWITPLITDCSLTNTLGYICFDGPKSSIPSDMTQIDEKLITIFPFASLENNPVAFKGVTGINTGQLFKLKYYDKSKGTLVDKFPKGTTIIWFLAAGIYDKATQTFNSSSNKAQNFYYSHAAWNTYEDENLRDHTTYYSVKFNNENYKFFGFEDTKRTNNKNCDNDFNDMVFMMKSNPTTAIEPPVVIDEEENPITVVEEKKKGVLAFEDNWPAAKDYDMNDIVIKYQSVTSYYNEYSSIGTCIVSINDIFDLVHSGANFNNGFSIKYDIDPTKVTSLMINGQSVTPRADGTGFVVDIFKNAFDYIRAYQPNQSHKFNVVINFQRNDKALRQADFQSKVVPYNPFIIPAEGVEVHLPMKEPSAAADMSFFGTADDCSNPAQKIYYVGKEGAIYPWAIHLAEVTDFGIPKEGDALDVAYPSYKSWVESGFSQTYAKWYIK